MMDRRRFMQQLAIELTGDMAPGSRRRAYRRFIRRSELQADGSFVAPVKVVVTKPIRIRRIANIRMA